MKNLDIKDLTPRFLACSGCGSKYEVYNLKPEEVIVCPNCRDWRMEDDKCKI